MNISQRVECLSTSNLEKLEVIKQLENKQSIQSCFVLDDILDAYINQIEADKKMLNDLAKGLDKEKVI